MREEIEEDDNEEDVDDRLSTECRYGCFFSLSPSSFSLSDGFFTLRAGDCGGGGGGSGSEGGERCVMGVGCTVELFSTVGSDGVACRR